MEKRHPNDKYFYVNYKQTFYLNLSYVMVIGQT